MSSSRPFPYAGMPVRVMHLGVTGEALVDEVLDDGRTLVVGGEAYTLREHNGFFVRRGEPYYGRRLLLSPPPPGTPGGPAAAGVRG